MSQILKRVMKPPYLKKLRSRENYNLKEGIGHKQVVVKEWEYPVKGKKMQKKMANCKSKTY